MSSMLNRLRELNKQYSQAEIARRVGCSRATVSRYLAGRTVSVEFCIALMKEFGVNPSWLMMGEGPPFLADALPQNNPIGKDILELVQAMEAVSEQSLGAIAGRDHRVHLRNLNTALKQHDALSETLDSRSKPAFKKILEEIKDAIIANNWDRARHLRKAAKQLARLCSDGVLHGKFHSLQGVMDARAGKVQAALNHHRQAFASSLLLGEAFTTEQIHSAHNFANLLERAGRLREARRVCGAILALIEDSHSHDHHALILIKKARLDLELGDLHTALEATWCPTSLISPDNKTRLFAVRTTALVFAADLDFPMLLASPESFSKAGTLFSLALWLENPEYLRTSAASFIAQSVPRQRERTVWIDSLILALTEKNPKALQDLRRERSKYPNGSHDLIEHSAIEAYVSERLGKIRIARKAVERVQGFIDDLPQGSQAHLWVRAVIHRTALRTLSKNSAQHSQALEFFKEHLAKGYRVFNDNELYQNS